MGEVVDVCACGGWEKNVSEPVERYDDGLFINGCCGGGCYVVKRIKFCPFCGKRLVF